MAHQYECSECAFMIRSDDDDEVIDHVRTHAQDAHGMQVADDDVRAGWEMTEASD
jgi:predicted small metal-binding protein